ncbi:NfeD family protein [Chloroflexota bacterium]
MKIHAVLLVMFLDDVAALALVFVILWFFKIRIPFYLATVIALLFGTLTFITHKAVMPILHKKKTTGSEGMIGLNGEVIEPLKPRGIVKVGDELWKARTVDIHIEAGEEVVIVSLKGLTLHVRCKDRLED